MRASRREAESGSETKLGGLNTALAELSAPGIKRRWRPPIPTATASLTSVWQERTASPLT